MADVSRADAVEQALDALGLKDPGIRAAFARQLEGGSSGDRSDSRDQTIRRWRDRARRSERLAKASLAKLEALACALGACPQCWGEDPECRECGGLGRCGRFLPDMACFRTYVTPIVKRVCAEYLPGEGEARRTAAEPAAKHPTETQDAQTRNGGARP